MRDAADTPDSPPVLDPDATILRIAATQYGVVSRDQLLRAGIPRHSIDYRVHKRRLRPLHHGVYAAGPVAGLRQREMAAVLACGDGAVLSHRTASALWELGRPRSAGPEIELLGPRRLRGPRGGVLLHRVRTLDPAEVSRKDGLPVTTPARTLLDLTGCAGLGEVERALARGLRGGIVTVDEIETVLARHAGRRGVPALRALLHAAGGPALTRSEAEQRLLELVRRGDLARPDVNVMVAGFEVDFVWPSRRLVVEIDGFEYHAGRAAFERDRRRDAVLIAAGFRVMRFTWRQLTREAETVLVQLAQALARGEPGGEQRMQPR